MPQLQERRPEQQRQYLPRFDLLDVGQDERPELDGEIAEAGVLIGDTYCPRRGRALLNEFM